MSVSVYAFIRQKKKQIMLRIQQICFALEYERRIFFFFQIIDMSFDF